MTYFEEEILHDLKLGENYTEKQLIIFLLENDNCKIISKSCNGFADGSSSPHRVQEIIEGYEHKGDVQQRIYYIPNLKSKIYVVN